MPLLMLLLLLFALIPARATQPGRDESCPIWVYEELAKIEEAEAILGRVEGRLAEYPPTSPVRSRIADMLGNRRAELDAFVDQLDAMERLGKSSLDRARGQIAELAELAEAPPIHYVNPGHHDPSSGTFRGGGSMTTTLPGDAETVFVNAVPEPGTRGTTWWGYNGTDYYRYQGSVTGEVTEIHWNGTTAGASAESRAIRFEDIPIEIRRRFGRVR